MSGDRFMGGAELLFTLSNKGYLHILENGEIARPVRKLKRQACGFGFHDFIVIDIKCN